MPKPDKPAAKPKPNREPRPPGGWEGQIRISEDFDAPLPTDIQAEFEGAGDLDEPTPREGS
jgi:hypothetical protein